MCVCLCHHKEAFLFLAAHPPVKTITIIISITPSIRELTRLMCVRARECTYMCVCLITVHTHLSVKSIAYVPVRSVLKYDSEFGDYNAALVFWVYCRVPLPARAHTHTRMWVLCVRAHASSLRSRALEHLGCRTQQLLLVAPQRLILCILRQQLLHGHLGASIVAVARAKSHRAHLALWAVGVASTRRLQADAIGRDCRRRHGARTGEGRCSPRRARRPRTRPRRPGVQGAAEAPEAAREWAGCS